MLPLKWGLKGNGRMKRIAIGLGLLAGLSPEPSRSCGSCRPCRMHW
jgi:hypothetical protein